MILRPRTRLLPLSLLIAALAVIAVAAQPPPPPESPPAEPPPTALEADYDAARATLTSPRRHADLADAAHPLTAEIADPDLRLAVRIASAERREIAAALRALATSR